MRPRTCRLALAFVPVALIVPQGAATAPCSPAVVPEYRVSDTRSGSTLYATHVLTVTGTVSTDPSASPRVSAPGARFLDEGGDTQLLRDTPGPLPMTLSFDALEPGGEVNCEATVFTTPILRAPTPLTGTWAKPKVIFRKKGRPHYPGQPRFAIRLRPSRTSSLAPVTVRARVARRAKLPGSGVKAASITYPLRDFEEGPPERRRKPGCNSAAIVCTKRVNTWATGVEVFVRLSRNLQIEVLPPAGYPVYRPRSVIRKTPFGVVVEAFQAGVRVARLRVAGSCLTSGQSSRCRFTTLSTKR